MDSPETCTVSDTARGRGEEPAHEEVPNVSQCPWSLLPQSCPRRYHGTSNLYAAPFDEQHRLLLSILLQAIRLYWYKLEATIALNIFPRIWNMRAQRLNKVLHQSGTGLSKLFFLGHLGTEM